MNQGAGWSFESGVVTIWNLKKEGGIGSAAISGEAADKGLKRDTRAQVRLGSIVRGFHLNSSQLYRYKLTEEAGGFKVRVGMILALVAIQ